MALSNFDELERDLAGFNLAYLTLAVSLIRADRPAASVRLGMSWELCRLLERLTVTELQELAKSTDFVMAPRSSEALQARLMMIRQGSSEVSQILDTVQPLWAEWTESNAGGSEGQNVA